ncbi:MAG: riboflavin synthase, partial [Emticicia sp.]
MFTGIVEATAQVVDIHAEGTNLTFTFESGIAPELKIDQSVSHNGVCLTVVSLAESTVNGQQSTISSQQLTESISSSY